MQFWCVNSVYYSGKEQFILHPLYFLMLGNRFTLPKQQILDSSKLKEFADENFKFYENGRKFSKWVESTVGNGEIACYEQFLLFS